MRVTNAKGVDFRDCTIDTESGPPVIVKGSSDIDTTRLKPRLVP